MSVARTYSLIATALLVVFLAAPAASLLAFGAAAPYGQRKFTKIELQPNKLLSNSDKSRRQLLNAVFERSPVTPAAIHANNWMRYRVFGHIDNSRIISGRNGWLFFKPQFWGGKCQPDDYFQGALRRVDALRALAERARLDVIFSVSPDKSSVHPEMLEPHAETYFACKAQNGERWRTFANDLAPALIDHTTTIRAGKTAAGSGPDGQMYYATDTHWNRRAQSLAVGDLVARLGKLRPDTRFDKTQIDFGNEPMRTDLRNNMLLIDEIETDPNQHVEVPRAKSISGGVTFIHDSFYNQAQPILKSAFPGAQFLHIQHDTPRYRLKLKTSTGVVVVNSVERFFFARFRSDMVSGIESAILERNSNEALQRCVFDANGVTASIDKVDNAKESAGTYVATNNQPRIYVKLPSPDTSCIRFEVTVTKPGNLEVMLPPLDRRQSAETFEPGRSFGVSLKPGTHTMTFILPKGMQQPALRIDPTNKKSRFSLSGLQIGNLVDANTP